MPHRATVGVVDRGRHSRQWIAGLGLAALLGAACGKTVPAGGVPDPEASAAPRAGLDRVQGADLIPADLDLVLRIDLARMRAGLGEESSAELSRRALDETGAEAFVREALERAEVAWLGLRVADLIGGDRVLVVESRDRPAEPDAIAWEAKPSDLEGVAIYDSIRLAPRSGTARIVTLPGETTIYVSPVELDSVNRILEQGPDPNRCQPAARGVLSLDWRVKPPSHQLQNRFPSLARLMRGIERLRATLEFRGQELRLEGRMSCRDEAAAERVLRFLSTIAATAQQLERYRWLLEPLKLQTEGNMVQLRWTLAPTTLVELLRAGRPTEDRTPPPTPAPDGPAAADEGSGPPVVPPGALDGETNAAPDVGGEAELD